MAELDAYYRAGIKIVFVVDDNLIGNKKAIKPILRDIMQWQEDHAYALTLFTEASLDLAEDDELMDLMGRAGFQSVFIGIESPNEKSLRETKKLQNVRERAGTLLERVRRVQGHGLDVWCGMIVGFDHDNPSVFRILPKFLADARIANALIGLLHAIPTTPLYDRLKKEGRLNDSRRQRSVRHQCGPLGMSREELRKGFIEVTREAYAADAYFQRLDALFVEGGFKFAVHELSYWQHHRWARAKSLRRRYLKFLVLAGRLMRSVKDEGLRAKISFPALRVLRRGRSSRSFCLFTPSRRRCTSTMRRLRLAHSGDGPLPEAVRSFSR